MRCIFLCVARMTCNSADWVSEARLLKRLIVCPYNLPWRCSDAVLVWAYKKPVCIASVDCVAVACLVRHQQETGRDPVEPMAEGAAMLAQVRLSVCARGNPLP